MSVKQSGNFTPNIELVLRNPFDKEQKLSVIIDLFWEKPITRRWLTLLKDSLRTNPHLDKSFCFLGFPGSYRNVERICSELEAHKEVINRYFSKWKFWRKNYHIGEVFSRQTAIENGRINQDLMNRLHHHFEVLSGQIWETSSFKKTAPAEVKFAIHKLNLLCHEMESLVQQYKNFDLNQLQERVCPSTMFSFLSAQRKELQEEDLDAFEYFQEFGYVYLHYAQIGKRWDEAFFDKDEHVFESGISGLRYYTGEFNIFWGKGEGRDFYQREEKTIRNWIHSKGVDPKDKRNALGWLYIGKVNIPKSFSGLELKQIQNLITDHLDICQISVHDHDETVDGFFEYSDTDESYSEMQLRLIEQSW